MVAVISNDSKDREATDLAISVLLNRMPLTQSDTYGYIHLDKANVPTFWESAYSLIHWLSHRPIHNNDDCRVIVICGMANLTGETLYSAKSNQYTALSWYDSFEGVPEYNKIWRRL